MAKALFEFLAEAAKSPTVAWRLFMMMVVGVHIAWACSWIPGIRGFALAGELDAKVTQLEQRLGAIESKQDIALRLALADEICRLYALRAENVSNPQLWRTLNDTFNARQQNYSAVNGGREYDIEQCSAPR